MIMDKELENFINGILDSYGIVENREQIFNWCYYLGLESKVNPQVKDYWPYVRAIVNNTIKPIVKESLGIKTEE